MYFTNKWINRNELNNMIRPYHNIIIDIKLIKLKLYISLVILKQLKQATPISFQDSFK